MTDLEEELEGTRVLEQLAAIGKLDEFVEAIDQDNLGRVVALMKIAKIDSETIDLVVRKIREDA